MTEPIANAFILFCIQSLDVRDGCLILRSKLFNVMSCIVPFILFGPVLQYQAVIQYVVALYLLFILCENFKLNQPSLITYALEVQKLT